jgi:hypothetical protein
VDAWSVGVRLLADSLHEHAPPVTEAQPRRQARGKTLGLRHRIDDARAEALFELRTNL